jgi:hypothetical protein
MTDPGAAPSEFSRRQDKKSLRRQRSNMRNLVGSLVVSLAIVALLIFIIPRPGGNQVPPVEWKDVASSSQISAPGPLLVPELDDTWRGNRADIRDNGGVIEWTVGLIGSGDEFVQVIQGFDAGPAWVSSQVRGRGPDGETSLGAGAKQVTWTIFDRSSVTDPGNRVWSVAAETESGWVVVTGLTQASVFLVASDLSTNQLEFFGGR